jgi:hypothetical protein
MRIQIAIAFLALLALLVLPPVSATQRGQIQIMVTDANGQPLSGAVVTCGNKIEVTGTAGKAGFSFLPVPAGYNVDASKGGQSQSAVVQLTEDNPDGVATIILDVSGSSSPLFSGLLLLATFIALLPAIVVVVMARRHSW